MSKINDKLITSLMLTEFEDYRLLELIVKRWTYKEKLRAFKWARTEYLSANDNPVKRFKKPKCVKELSYMHGQRNVATGIFERKQEIT